MLKVAFGELARCLESYEVADGPRHLASIEIAGVVSLPLRLEFRR
jgi:hypothetical protein